MRRLEQVVPARRRDRLDGGADGGGGVAAGDQDDAVLDDHRQVLDAGQHHRRPVGASPGSPSASAAITGPCRALLVGLLGPVPERVVGADVAPADVGGDHHRLVGLLEDRRVDRPPPGCAGRPRPGGRRRPAARPRRRRPRPRRRARAPVGRPRPGRPAGGTGRCRRSRCRPGRRHRGWAVGRSGFSTNAATLRTGAGALRGADVAVAGLRPGGRDAEDHQATRPRPPARPRLMARCRAGTSATRLSACSSSTRPSGSSCAATTAATADGAGRCCGPRGSRISACGVTPTAASCSRDQVGVGGVADHHRRAEHLAGRPAAPSAGSGSRIAAQGVELLGRGPGATAARAGCRRRRTSGRV